MDTVTLQYSGNGLVLEPCEAAWISTDVDNITVTRDTADKMAGEASAKIVIGAGVDAGQVVAYRTLPQDLDASDMASLKLQLKVSGNINANDFQLVIGQRVGAGMTPYNFDLPAQLAADGWEEVTLVGDFTDLTAIMHFGLVMVVDKGAITVNIDDIRATLASVTLNALSVKGIDSPDVVSFPKVANYDNLSGASVVRVINYKRMPAIELAAITVKADRLKLFRWIYRSEQQQIVYNGETMDVVLADPAGYELEWLEGVSFATGFTLILKEKNARSSIPDSWLA
jgi:hypothetical protein